jgi:putative redox protein
MTTATITWLGGMTFDAESRGHHLMTDSVGGVGKDRGPTPTELLLMGLAGCTAMDVVSILQKKRQPVTGVVVRAEGEQADEHPHRFTRIVVTYEVAGEGVELAAVERAVALSEDKYCSVAATLREPTEILTRIVLVGA